jgi:hypothetical protein
MPFGDIVVRKLYRRELRALNASQEEPLEARFGPIPSRAVCICRHFRYGRTKRPASRRTVRDETGDQPGAAVRRLGHLGAINGLDGPGV